MDTEAHAVRTRKPLPHWLLEGFFIVVSVALGFGVAQYGERRSEREFAGRVLDGIVAEVEHNHAVLAPLVPIHRSWVETLANAATSEGSQSALDVYFAARPQLPPGAQSPFPILRRSAWDAAVSGGALRLIDYDVAASLSEIYRMQEIAADNVDRLATGALSSTDTYRPATRHAALRLLWLTLADIQSAEAMLLDLYEQHLPAIRSAASAK